MRRMRSNNKLFSTLALFAVAAVFAAPAFAAQSVAPATSPPIALRAAVAKVADWARKTAHEERRRAKRAEGPFVPIVGKVDYGTAENAFGAPRSGHIHAGQDMFADPGTPEIAATDGVVLETGNDGGQGNYVYLYDPKRDHTYVYMHMIEPPKVDQGERVEAGQLLGGVGCTGSCWGDHLHFEVHDGRGFETPARDPMPLLADWRSIDKPR